MVPGALGYYVAKLVELLPAKSVERGAQDLYMV